MSDATTPGDKIRRYARQQGLSQQELDYLLGVLGEAVLMERERLNVELEAIALHLEAAVKAVRARKGD